MATNRRATSAATSIVSLLMLAGSARAQSQALDFDLQPFHGVSTAGGLVSVEGAEIGTHLRPRFQASFVYDHRPLVYQAFGQPLTAVGARLSGELSASVGALGRAELGISLPFVLYQAGDRSRITAGISSGGLGDLRIVPKVLLVRRAMFAMSLSAGLRLPTGASDALSASGLAFEPQLLFTYKRAHLALTAAAGYRVLPRRQLFDLIVDDQLIAGAGGRYRLTADLSVVGELSVATAAAAPFSSRQRTPALLLAGLRYHLGDLLLSAAGGPGLISGYGTPVLQIQLTVGWDSAGVDSDGDGVRDRKDACPLQPEDHDGYADHDGCPDLDNDGDGIADGADRCPSEPEDRDGFEDEDGCPDLDNDRDGVPDTKDRCPNRAEDRDAFQDEDGCPDLDNDRDGVPDKKDRCPNKPETLNGIDDEDGCPESDRDLDGIFDDKDKCPDRAEDKNGIEDEDGCPEDRDGDRIVDRKDRCPDEKETYNGYQDKDGCPDQRRVAVVIRRRVIWTSEAIYFPTDKWDLSNAAGRLLRKMARAILRRRGLKVVYVEGHADPRGPEKYNQWLSFRRAKTVVRYLHGLGVPSRMLRAVGWGKSRPWDTNETREGRARNRRVRFHVDHYRGRKKSPQETR